MPSIRFLEKSMPKMMAFYKKKYVKKDAIIYAF